MPEYIEREALIAEYDRVHKGPAGGARKLMVEAPAADVVEVVRCKDCHFWDTDYKGLNGECVCKLHSLIGFFTTYRLPDSFCNNGERRSDNG